MRYSPHSTDIELVEGCRNRNRLAQKYLYQRYFGKMLGIPMRYTGNKETATEVLNMAFFKVFKSIDKYEPSGKLHNWIAKIVFNASIDHVRQHTVYKQRMDFETEKEAVIQCEALENLLVEDLYKLIQLLPPASRTVFCMYCIDGYKHKEIAEQLNISVGTSKWHLAFAKKQLRKLLKITMIEEV